jgi:DNA polymerase
MSISRQQMLHEMGLSPQWKLRDNPSVLRGAQMPELDEPLADAAPAVAEVVAQLVAEAPAVPIKRELPAPAADRPQQIARMDWDALQQGINDCRACKLCEERQRAVLGVGGRSADWLFVGEGPGAEEDASGEPFVGPSGKLLDAMLAAIDLQRGEDVYLANAVKCHSPANHAPEAAEIAACAPYLKRQISLLQPKLIVLLGRAAVHALLGSEGLLGSLRGKSFEYRDGDRAIPVVVTYHPSYLLRTLPDKAKAWEDLCRARTLMREAKGGGLAGLANSESASI